MNEILSKAAFHKKKIAVGTIITILVVGWPQFKTAFKWYEKQGDTRNRVKDLEKETESLKKCERDAHDTITRLEARLNQIEKRLDKLEYRIDRIPH